jgi:GR25 family glycosyltransferase involved in LPS biosynthesis
MKFSELPKFVVNLDHRPENMSQIQEEMSYIGWSYERFSAVNRNSYMGCTLSHLECIKIAKDRGYKRVMVIEDDCIFMPYAKSFLEKLESQIENIEFSVFNVTPTLNRNVNRSEKYDLLLDITDLPPRINNDNADTFATNMMIYDESVYDDMFNISTTAFTSGDYYYPIDGYLAHFIYPKKQSYCPVVPVAPQRKSYSDVSQGMYNNYYTQVYNWNQYSPIKIENYYINQEKMEEIKTTQKHIEYNVG